MQTKIISFLVTIALVIWQIVDIIRGVSPTLSWIMLGVFILIGITEVMDIIKTQKKEKEKENQ